DLLALHDVSGTLGALDEVVHQRVDAPRAPVAEERNFLVRQLRWTEDPEADGIVNVVVDVGDTVDDSHDLALERRRLLRPGVSEDPIANLLRQVQRLRNPQRLLVVAEGSVETLL